MNKNMEYIYKIYQEGGFSKAAKALYISQPALSAIVRRTERQLHATLFDRSQNPVRLTPAGEYYIRCIERIQAIEREMEGYFADLSGGSRGTLAIGSGAYYCTYPSFVDVYHVFGRMMERTGMSVFLMLCTLNFINIETDDENQKYYSELLRESIQKAVRKGDFYTRYNIQQYLVMLIGITQENCTLVSKRINKEFNKRLTRRKNVSIDYYVASLGEVCND